MKEKLNYNLHFYQNDRLMLITGLIEHQQLILVSIHNQFHHDLI